ncbi:MAG: hypothetical protein COT74_01800 [Bdellovibrionales bacterium CG10_big_fil_rev_8_21_14_0_10_45_34]|nr:MAG: hypothetical protein COT74_01800 [Bdellovibrionales bacterium CG10_big_fil_rev_8_21_14_0_10_45_34]
MKSCINSFLTIFAITLAVSAVFAQSGRSVRERQIENRRDRDGSLIVSIAAMVNNKVQNIERSQFRDEVGLGGGVLVEANIQDWFGIETGALLTNKQYDWGRDGFRVVQETVRLHVPVLARFWATDFFSLGVGPYASFRVGDTRTSGEAGPFQASIDTPADDTVTLGADLAATLNLAISDKTGFFIEGRYSYPFNEDNSSSLSQLAGLAGVKIDL